MYDSFKSHSVTLTGDSCINTCQEVSNQSFSSSFTVPAGPKSNVVELDSPFQPKKSEFTRKKFNSQFCSFQSTWFTSFPWLHYDEESDSVLCFICAISEIITLCELLNVNSESNANGERSFSLARRVKMWLRSDMGQKRFDTTTIPNSRKERTKSLRIIDVANKLVEVNDNRKRHFGTFTV